MKTLATVALLALTAASQADEIEPAVVTSSSAAAPAAPAAAAVPASAATPAARGPGKAAATVKPPAGQKSGAHDQIVLDPTQITGNRELPRVMYVVPWKRPDLGELGGKPAKSLLDEVLEPVDRDVFQRQNRYYSALHPDVAGKVSTPAAAAAGDEK